jgi:hypothetical protein
MKPCNLSNAVLFDDPERVDEARAICKRGCLQLIECRYQALHTDVAGVCGGLTEQERAMWRETFGVSLPAPVVPIAEPKPRRYPPEVTAERRTAAQTMHQQNMSQRQIAAALGISQMAVWNLLKDAA